MIIIGAGISGLLCGALNHGSIIYEKNSPCDKGHQALFRCRSNQIGKVLGIEFKEVTVSKAIWHNGREVSPTPRLANLYSQKVAGKILDRSISDISTDKRFLPPQNFVEILKSRCNTIHYNTEFDIEVHRSSKCSGTPIVSTIPMPAMLSILGIKHKICFSANSIYVSRLHIANCDANCTIYYPDPTIGPYRASLTQNLLIIESIMPIGENDLCMVCDSIGVSKTSCESTTECVMNYEQKFGKITPIDSIQRKNSIVSMTIHNNVYSLGRFATWRPKVVFDDILDDIDNINRLIRGGSYAALQHKQEERN